MSYLVDAQEARATMTDWYTARVVAILVAVNSKRRRYDPLNYMANGAEIRGRAREAAERRVLTGDELLMKMKRLGVPIIDNRQKGANDGDIR